MGSKLFLNYQETKGKTTKGVSGLIFAMLADGRINDKIDAAVERGIVKMKAFGLEILDEDGTRNALQAAFLEVTEKFPGVDGKLFLKLDVEHMALRQTAGSAWDKKRGNKDAMFVWDPFWTPGTEKNSATEEQLNGEMKVAACFTPFNAEKTGQDTMLFALSLPFDDHANKKYHNGDYKDTQMAFVERVLAEYAETGLEAGDQNDFLALWLDELESGADLGSDDFLLNCGYARVPRLGRQSVGGDSCVGDVYSGGGRPHLHGSGGGAGGDCGVFFRAGVEVKSEA